MIDLDELERLAAQATPRPWVDKGIGSIYSPARRKTIAECMPPICRGLKNIQQHGINSAYIVAACNSLPDLIADNRALLERVRYLEEQNKELSGWNYEFQREARKLQFQLEHAAKEAGEDAAIVG